MGGSNETKRPVESDSGEKVSITVRMIRHAESANNQVYRNARYIYRGGTPDFDQQGWNDYVDQHRRADPSLSDIGQKQSQRLAEFLVPHCSAQASQPVRVVTSPMRRTLETIRPTLEGLQRVGHATQVTVHGFYFESEGCHLKEKPEEGMNPSAITQLLQHEPDGYYPKDIRFVGFPDPERGWYIDGKGPETREEAEQRAARFYLWLLEELDQELLSPSHDVFDAGVAVPGEEAENEHDKTAPRVRRRRTTLLIGHGDFMSLVLKRLVAGFGHVIEAQGVPHRSAFVHFNTGITELEYFGNGRFLIMAHNMTPHIRTEEHIELRGGGSLKDGWSYLVPNDEFMIDAEVSVAFSDELEGHVREQTEALKSLYLSSHESKMRSDDSFLVESSGEAGDEEHLRHFIVKRGMQVVGVATYSDATGRLTDVAVRPSAGKAVSETLFAAVQKHANRIGRSPSLVVLPRSDDSKAVFQDMGFVEMPDSGEDSIGLSFKI